MTEFKDSREYVGWVQMQFYPGGYVRTLNSIYIAAPALSGRRGVLYKKHGKFWLVHQGMSQEGSLTKETFKIKVEGDRIYLMLKLSVTENIFFFQSGFDCQVYEKAGRVPEDWKGFRPDW